MGSHLDKKGLTILSIIADLCALGTVIYWIISNI